MCKTFSSFSQFRRKTIINFFSSICLTDCSECHRKQENELITLRPLKCSQKYHLRIETFILQAFNWIFFQWSLVVIVPVFRWCCYRVHVMKNNLLLFDKMKNYQISTNRKRKFQNIFCFSWAFNYFLGKIHAEFCKQINTYENNYERFQQC